MKNSPLLLLPQDVACWLGSPTNRVIRMARRGEISGCLKRNHRINATGLSSLTILDLGFGLLVQDLWVPHLGFKKKTLDQKIDPCSRYTFFQGF